ncbi:hypothetical protein ACVXZ4_08385 [Lacisediminihabitans sp. FW035]
MSPKQETIVVIVTTDDGGDLSTSWSANETGEGLFAGPLRVPAAQAAADHAAVEIFDGELWTADAFTSAGAYAAIAHAAGTAEYMLDRGPGALVARILGADTGAI